MFYKWPCIVITALYGGNTEYFFGVARQFSDDKITFLPVESIFKILVLISTTTGHKHFLRINIIKM